MRYIFVLLALLCASCGTALPSIKPYKLDIQQGNVVNSKMLLQLRPGMTKSQVRFIMGTPLVQDSFHGNRWDYVYQLRESGKIVEQRRVILDFENELLKSVRGDVVAAGSEQAKDSETATPSGTRVVTPIKAEEEKGLLDKLKFWEGDKKATEKIDGEAAAKTKLEAEPAVINPAPAAAPESKLPESKVEPVTDQPASILAVPIEIGNDMPSGSPSVPPTPEVQTAPMQDAPRVDEPKVEARPATPAPVVAPISPVAVEPDVPQEQISAPKAVESAPTTAPAPEGAPTDGTQYQSPAGMQFDRKIQVEGEESISEVESSAGRSGNKVAPKPKELPEEKDPSFFDRMLEQIGF